MRRSITRENPNKNLTPLFLIDTRKTTILLVTTSKIELNSYVSHNRYNLVIAYE